MSARDILSLEWSMVAEQIQEDVHFGLESKPGQFFGIIL